jgi:hypothetical protein
MHYPRFPLRIASMAVLAALLCGPVWAETPDSASGAVPAEWTPKEMRFIYMGFTAKFSCDGLADRMRQVLLLLGARKDLRVSPTACASGFGRPDPFPGVTIKMNVLEPADSKGAQGNASAQTVPAHWKMVDVDSALARDPLWRAGQCELLEQIKQTILPMFSARNVHYQSNCIPNQLNVGATQLKAELLIADPQDTKSASPPATAH